MTIADRLRQARVAAGYEKAADFARAVGVKPVTYRAHENGQNAISPEMAERYAKRLRITPEWLLYGTGPRRPFPPELLNGPTLEESLADLPPAGIKTGYKELDEARAKRRADIEGAIEMRNLLFPPDDASPPNRITGGLRSVTVLGAVEAGVWREALEWPEDERFTTPVAGLDYYQDVPLYGLVVRGQSMNQVFPDGSIVICCPLMHMKRDLRAGDRVVVEKRRHGLAEATVKELDMEDGKPILRCKSDHPKFQGALRLEDPADDQGTEIAVSGIVVASVRFEAQNGPA